MDKDVAEVAMILMAIEHAEKEKERALASQDGVTLGKICAAAEAFFRQLDDRLERIDGTRPTTDRERSDVIDRTCREAWTIAARG